MRSPTRRSPTPILKRRFKAPLPRPAPEESLRVPVVRHFQRLGYDVSIEVPFYSRYADVAGVNGRGDVFAVELKLADWRAALQQAKAYQLGATKSYVGLPVGKLTTPLNHKALFLRDGVGLLAIDHETGAVEERLPPGPSPRLLPWAARAVGDLIERDVTGGLEERLRRTRFMRSLAIR